MISLVWLMAQAAMPSGRAPAPVTPAPVTPGPVAPAAPALPWAVVERAGQAPGTRSVSASANAPGGAGRLVVRCDHAGSPVVSVQFIPRDGLRGFGQQPVSLQFDGGTPLIDNWEMMGAGVVEREARATATLSTGIAHARQIRLRTTDRAGAPIDVVLAGPGSDVAIRRVVEACGQPFGLPAALPAPTPEPGPGS